MTVRVTDTSLSLSPVCGKRVSFGVVNNSLILVWVRDQKVGYSLGAEYCVKMSESINY